MKKLVKNILITLILLYSIQGLSQDLMRYEAGLKINMNLPYNNNDAGWQYIDDWRQPPSLFLEYKINSLFSMGIESRTGNNYSEIWSPNIDFINSTEQNTIFISRSRLKEHKTNLYISVQIPLNKRISLFSTLNNSFYVIDRYIARRIYLRYTLESELGIEYKVMRNIFLSFSAGRSNLLNTLNLAYLDSDGALDYINPKLSYLSMGISFGFGGVIED